jgi:hypothetical protein
METETQTIEIQVSIPVGWKAVGFRQVERGDRYLLTEGRVETWTSSGESACYYVILQKVPVFRGVTLEDVAKAIAGQTIRVWFSDGDGKPVKGSLAGVFSSDIAGKISYISSTGSYWSAAVIEVTDEATN